jgi:hypothetical protein
MKIKFSSPIGNGVYDKVASVNGTAPPLCVGPGLKKELSTSWCGPHFYYDMSSNYRSDIAREMRKRDPGFNFKIAILNMDAVQLETVTKLLNSHRKTEENEIPLTRLQTHEIMSIPDSGNNDLAQIMLSIRDLYSKVASDGWNAPRVSTFVYRPYIYPDSLVANGALFASETTPMLRIGDSLLTGDPNASTGLQTHLAIIRHFQCTLWDKPESTCHSPAYPPEEDAQNAG